LIQPTDYGENNTYSLFDNAVGCANSLSEDKAKKIIKWVNKN